MKPLVSIVMPVYNAGLFLKDAINDILVQTYDNLELICVNDGSTDDSLAVLQFFAEKDRRIKILNQSNMGAAEARNNGISITAGDYLMILDSDDRFESDMIERVLEKAEKCDADITLFDGYAFDKKTQIIYEMKFLYRENIPQKEVFSYLDVPDRILQLSIESPWNKLYRTSFVKNNNIRFLTSRYCNDVCFVMTSMELADKICVLNEKLIYYRTGNRLSVTRGRIEDPGCLFEVLNNTLRELKKSDRYNVVWKSYANYSWERIYSHILEVLDENNYEIFLEYLNKEIIHSLKIDRMEEQDFDWDEFFRDIECYKKKGHYSLLFRIFRRNAFYMLDKEYGLNAFGNASHKEMFDIGRIPEGSRLILYGAGKRGKILYEKINQNKKYEVVKWIDKNSDLKDELVGDLTDLKNVSIDDYEYIVIAVDSPLVVREIVEQIENIVPKERIVW